MNASRVTGLPGVLAEIEAIAGRAAALELSLALGGCDLYVRRQMPVPPELAGTIAGDRWAAIARRFGGETLHIPLARRALVRHLTARGLDTTQIARRLRITQRTVRRYRRQGAA